MRSRRSGSRCSASRSRRGFRLGLHGMPEGTSSPRRTGGSACVLVALARLLRGTCVLSAADSSSLVSRREPWDVTHHRRWAGGKWAANPLDPTRTFQWRTNPSSKSRAADTCIVDNAPPPRGGAGQGTVPVWRQDCLVSAAPAVISPTHPGWSSWRASARVLATEIDRSNVHVVEDLAKLVRVGFRRAPKKRASICAHLHFPCE